MQSSFLEIGCRQALYTLWLLRFHFLDCSWKIKWLAPITRTANLRSIYFACLLLLNYIQGKYLSGEWQTTTMQLFFLLAVIISCVSYFYGMSSSTFHSMNPLNEFPFHKIVQFARLFAHHVYLKSY